MKGYRYVIYEWVFSHIYRVIPTLLLCNPLVNPGIRDLIYKLLIISLSGDRNVNVNTLIQILELSLPCQIVAFHSFDLYDFASLRGKTQTGTVLLCNTSNYTCLCMQVCVTKYHTSQVGIQTAWHTDDVVLSHVTQLESHYLLY